MSHTVARRLQLLPALYAKYYTDNELTDNKHYGRNNGI